MSINVALLSGAFKNAGDFLIEQRSQKLCTHIIPDCNIQVYLRNEIANNLDDINKCDIVLLCGGPIFMTEIDGYLPLSLLSEKLNRPLSIIGGGWYGIGDGNNQVRKYRFSSKTSAFLHGIMEKGGVISARDNLTYNALIENGLSIAELTGCPAWYDLNYVDEIKINCDNNPKSIVISDPADYYNYHSCISLISYVREKYPEATIRFAFHRGISKAAAPIVEELKRLSIELMDISGDSTGFSIYDNCDLHIGYRVHAHIYCLSIRKKTVLIEEDGRGAGVDKTLGLPGIKAYSDLSHSSIIPLHKLYKRLPVYENKSLINELDNYLSMLEMTDNQYLVNAFSLQKAYYKKMKEVILQASKLE